LFGLFVATGGCAFLCQDEIPSAEKMQTIDYTDLTVFDLYLSAKRGPLTQCSQFIFFEITQSSKSLFFNDKI